MNEMTENNGLATVEQIRAVGSRGVRRHKMVGPLPVSGLFLRIQSLTEREMARHDAEAISYSKAGVKRSAIENANARLFVRCLVDADANRLFADHETAVFADWDAADTRYLYDEIAEHVGVRRADEEAVKNSEMTIVADSRSSSPNE